LKVNKKTTLDLVILALCCTTGFGTLPFIVWGANHFITTTMGCLVSTTLGIGLFSKGITFEPNAQMEQLCKAGIGVDKATNPLINGAG